MSSRNFSESHPTCVIAQSAPAAIFFSSFAYCQTQSALHVLERRYGHRDVKGPAGAAQLVDHPDQLDRVDVEDRGLRGRAARAGSRPVAGQGEDVLDPERLEVLQRLAEARAVLADARDVHVGREPAGPRRGAHPHRVVAHRAAGVARDAPGDDVGHARQPRGHLEELGLALEAGGDELDDVAEATRAEGVGQRVRRHGPSRPGGQPPSSARTSRVPSTIALSFAKATSRGRCIRPQSGLTASPLAGTRSRAARMRSATTAGVSMSWLLTSTTPSPSVNWRIEVLEQADVVLAPPRELERQLVDAGVEDRREQVAVAAFPRGLAVAVPVADVEARFAPRRPRRAR